MDQEKFQEFLYEVYEHEKGGVQVYQAALKCVQNDELREEWEKYLYETKQHVERARELLEHFGLDAEKETTGRKITRHLGQSLIKAMELGGQGGDPDQAEVVAAECVEIAEAKDHHNWELVGLALEKLKSQDKTVVKEAHKEIEDQEDEHYYHTKGWARELHLQGLGLKAVLPPPEEKKDVKTAIGAARAAQSRTKTAKRKTG